MNSVRFILIDDDEINNRLCTILIRQTFKQVEIQTFMFSEDGLAFLQELSNSESEMPIVLFLDINMHGMNGWEFLEHYENLNGMIRTRIRIYILSSSVNEEDIKKAVQHKSVVNYIIKPLKKQILRDIAESLQTA